MNALTMLAVTRLRIRWFSISTPKRTLTWPTRPRRTATQQPSSTQCRCCKTCLTEILRFWYGDRGMEGKIAHSETIRDPIDICLSMHARRRKQTYKGQKMRRRM